MRYHSKVWRECLRHEEACQSRLQRYSSGQHPVVITAGSTLDTFHPLQCWIPVLEGILPDDHNKVLLDLAFDMATWHSYAKLQTHTAYTIDSFRTQTKELGSQLRRYVNKVCSKYETKKLPGEAAASYRRKAAKVKKGASTSQQPDSSNTGSKSRKGSNFKKFNLETYKIHALGDYADHIKRFGTTDCYTTQQVWLFPHILPLQVTHHDCQPNRGNLSTGGSRSSTSTPTRSGSSARSQNTSGCNIITASMLTC